MPEDGPFQLSFFPNNWHDKAVDVKPVKNLRKDKNIVKYLRTRLLHIGCGYSFSNLIDHHEDHEGHEG